jgi:hypothetical protein
MKRTVIACIVLFFCQFAYSQTRPIVGAIRWDAWHGSQGRVGRNVEMTLSPEKYHYRLPFFAKINSKDNVTIDGSSQEVMDKEIKFASNAGLDYWAFCLYDENDPDLMSLGLKTYLKSKIRNKINFCMFIQGVNWLQPRNMPWALRLLKEPGYQTVLDGRPLVFIGFTRMKKDDQQQINTLKKQMKDFLAAAQKAGLKKPYIAFDNPEAARLFDGDALSAYAAGINRPHLPYSGLVEHTEKHWNGQKATGYPVIPIVMAGWDVRPRIDHHVFWIKKMHAKIDEYVQHATPQQVANHLQDAIDWLKTNPASAGPNAILIYAWNENDEGGWIVPTLFEGKARLDAIAKILKK